MWRHFYCISVLIKQGKGLLGRIQAARTNLFFFFCFTSRLGPDCVKNTYMQFLQIGSKPHLEISIDVSLSKCSGYPNQISKCLLFHLQCYTQLQRQIQSGGSASEWLSRIQTLDKRWNKLSNQRQRFSVL